MSRVLTDFHSHILPGLDDGAPGLQEALGMARQASRLGFRRIVATPHYEVRFYENRRPEIRQKVDELNELLRQESIELEILPGAEIMLDPAIPALLERKELMTMEDKEQNILVELPFFSRPIWLEEVVYRIQLLGLTPIVAHPERYEWLNKSEEEIAQLQRLGLEFQCNLSSMVGKYGARVKEKALYIKNQQLVKYWGSDAHSVRGYEILSRELIAV